MENNRKNLMFSVLYRIGDDGSIVIPTFDIDELKRKDQILNSLEFDRYSSNNAWRFK